MPTDLPNDLRRACNAVAKQYLVTYEEEEGNFGAFEPIDGKLPVAVINGFGLAIKRVAETYEVFEFGEDPSVFSRLARRFYGLPEVPPVDDDWQVSEPSKQVRGAARLELRLEDMAAEVMWSGLGGPDDD